MIKYPLDIRTLSFVTVLFSFIYGIGLLSVARYTKRFPGIFTFGTGVLCLCAGFFLLGLRNSLPPWLTVISANTLIFLSFVIMNKGLGLFFSLGNRSLFIGLLQATLLIPLFIYFTYPAPSVSNRIIAISLCLSLQLSLCAFDILHNAMEDIRLARWMTFIPFAASALFFLFRASWAMSQGLVHSFFSAGAVHQTAFLVVNMLVLTSSFGLLWMLSGRLETELVEQARTDALTQVLNRKALLEIAPRELARATRHGLPLSVILTDIDHFKAINDTYGHVVGDTVLAAFANDLGANIRTQDVLVRYGGEEFLILLPDTTAEQAVQVAEKIRTHFTSAIVEEANAIRITSSFGVAQLQLDETWQALISRVDSALYAAKNAGRNRVATA